ncbi:MAG: universal stress protein [Gammaproteobacteria bacterium]|nr:MAG: universal stress protein [Gammaproteobacteria bacterium]RLA60590.1 MAG: universal stress protein [Gammaproteobacteria bacterium]
MSKILIIADIKDKCYAIPRGLQLAAKLGQDTDVVAFTYAPLKQLKVKTTEQADIRKRLLAERERDVQARINKFRQPGQKVCLEVVWAKDIDRWVSKRCATKKYLGVVKTGNRSDSLVHTSTDWQLLRECPAPVLLVAEKKWHRARPVLVTLDLSSSMVSKRALNDKVLGIAKGLAGALDVELEIITAIEIPTLLSDLDLVDPIAFVKEAKEDMKSQIRKLAAAHDIPESAFHCKRGPVEKVITSRAAKVRAQIVVMGTVARKGVRARLLGNTAERVLRHMKTDVMAIKP